MDITEQILDDHDRQRRLFAQLDEVDRDDSEKLSVIWECLATFLEVHAQAEEELFYPPLLKVGTGAADADSSDEETEDAIGDHNDIRDGIRRTRRHDVGSDAWWDAVSDTRIANSKHMAEEERQALADFRRHTDADTRNAIGASFAAYEASHVTGVEADDSDPGRYVQEHS